MIKFNILCLVLLFSGLVVADRVPVLLWGPSNHYTPATALKTYNGPEFTDIVTPYTKEGKFVIVFAEDQLTTEDLAQCKTTEGQTCFQRLRKISNKLYLSSVEDPVAIISNEIGGLSHVDVTISADGTLSQPINTADGQFNFVSFEDGPIDETKSEKLARHDQLISSLSDELAAQNLKPLFIYTGKRSEHQRHVRQAPAANATSTATTAATTAATKPTVAAPIAPKQADPSDTPTFFSNTRMLLYYTGFFAAATPDDRAIVLSAPTITEITANILEVVMTGDGNTFKFNITGDSGYWWVDQFEWNARALISDTRVYALETFSFHCSPTISLKSGGEVVLKWRGLQLEPRFGVLADQPFESFGDSWDCVGFVSPGILGGLFVVIMLLFILSIGISWMMEINTMDRFDDPKGKTITINASD